ncbi:TPA: MFS transporter, partial [Candidatus Bipolaricaulota bacterium]|nr:MFS transporter [Candidatus Bipolaricaulota bacterium]
MILRPRSLYAIALIMNAATGVLVVAVPLLAIRFGATPFQLGLLGSLGAFAYTIVCPFSGRYSDAAGSASAPHKGGGRRRVILMSCALLIVVDLFIFFVSRLRDVFILTVCGSFCAGFFWAPLQAWLAEIGGGLHLLRRLGRFNLSWSLGIMVGPVIGGCLYSLDYRFPWCYAVATNVFILAILFAARDVMRKGGGEQRPEPRGARHGGMRGYLTLARWANFVCWFSLASVQSLYPKLAIVQGFSPQLIGYLLFLVGVAQSAFFVLLSLSPFWHYRYLPLVAVHGLAAVGIFAIYKISSVPLLSAAFPLLGLALALSYYS